MGQIRQRFIKEINRLNILITAIGKRVELIQHLKKDNFIIGVDCMNKNEIAAGGFVDVFHKIAKCTIENEKKYIEDIIEISKKEKIDMIIPLYEPEFCFLDKYRQVFESLNVTLLLSDKGILELCLNKFELFNNLKDKSINLPIVYDMFSCLESNENIISKVDDYVFPLIIKPAIGMGSIGVYKINSIEEFYYITKKICDNRKCVAVDKSDYIIQEYIEGLEYSIDVLFDLEGDIISMVPRLRDVVKSGEVEKSTTLNIFSFEAKIIIHEMVKTINAIKVKGKMIGPFTFQGIAKNEKFYILEINPRFGGGVTLSINAGVDYSFFFKKMLLGYEWFQIRQEIEREKLILINGYQIVKYKYMKMLRYDKGVYLENK